MLCSVAFANDFFTGNAVHNGQDHGIGTDTFFHGVQCFGEPCGFDCHNDQISGDSLGGRHTGEGQFFAVAGDGTSFIFFITLFIHYIGYVIKAQVVCQVTSVHDT